MKIGLIGFGSIGKRHVENLIKLGFKDITLLRVKGRSNELKLNELFIESEFLNIHFDFIIISNPPSKHFYFIKKLVLLQRNFIVEKPLVHLIEEVKELKYVLKDYNGLDFCAFNLRFHPAVKKVKELLNNKIIGKIYSARFFVGQNLIDWRPDSDYKESYSAKINLGGGVILDLIHEIDLAQFYFGKEKKHFHSIVDKLSTLRIETEDIAEIHYKSEQDVIVSIHLDYLVKGYSRYFEIIGENGRIVCDIFKPSVTIIGQKNKIIEKIKFINFKKNDMYVDLIKYFITCLKKNENPTPSLSDAIHPLETAIKAKSFRS